MPRQYLRYSRYKDVDLFDRALVMMAQELQRAVKQEKGEWISLEVVADLLLLLTKGDEFIKEEVSPHPRMVEHGFEILEEMGLAGYAKNNLECARANVIALSRCFAEIYRFYADRKRYGKVAPSDYLHRFRACVEKNKIECEAVEALGVGGYGWDWSSPRTRQLILNLPKARINWRLVKLLKARLLGPFEAKLRGLSPRSVDVRPLRTDREMPRLLSEELLLLHELPELGAKRIVEREALVKSFIGWERGFDSYIICIDVSGSMFGWGAIELALATALVLGELGRRYHVPVYAIPFSNQPLAVVDMVYKPQSIVEYVAGGGTDIAAAIRAAHKFALEKKLKPNIIVVTDGLSPFAEVAYEEKLRIGAIWNIIIVARTRQTVQELLSNPYAKEWIKHADRVAAGNLEDCLLSIIEAV